MNRFALCRVLGNEIPGLYRTGYRQRILEWIVANEPVLPDCTKSWLVAGVLDPEEYQRYTEALAHQAYTVIHPQLPKTRSFSTLRGAMKVFCDINRYRNQMFDAAVAAGAEWVIMLDSSVYLPPEFYEELLQEIEADRRKDCLRHYYILPTVRVQLTAIPPLAVMRSLPQTEPMLVLHRDAPFKFNEDRFYGQQDKISLLTRIGCSSKPGLHHTIVDPTTVRAVSRCVHLDDCDDIVLSNTALRMARRQRGLQELHARFEERVAWGMLSLPA